MYRNCNFSICSVRPAAPSGHFFQNGQNLPLRAPNSAPRTGPKISVSLSALIHKYDHVLLGLYAANCSVCKLS